MRAGSGKLRRNISLRAQRFAKVSRSKRNGTSDAGSLMSLASRMFRRKRKVRAKRGRDQPPVTPVTNRLAKTLSSSTGQVSPEAISAAAQAARRRTKDSDSTPRTSRSQACLASGKIVRASPVLQVDDLQHDLDKAITPGAPTTEVGTGRLRRILEKNALLKKQLESMRVLFSATSSVRADSVSTPVTSGKTSQQRFIQND